MGGGAVLVRVVLTMIAFSMCRESVLAAKPKAAESLQHLEKLLKDTRYYVEDETEVEAAAIPPTPRSGSIPRSSSGPLPRERIASSPPGSIHL